jgi:hypothetical protein
MTASRQGHAAAAPLTNATCTNGSSGSGWIRRDLRPTRCAVDDRAISLRKPPSPDPVPRPPHRL